MKKFEVHAKTDCELLDKIKEIFDFKNNKFDEKKIQIFVHGSWADNTRTSFSDLDDLVIIEDSYYKKAKKTLEELELEFQKIDPLQHHGHWLIKKSDLINYDNSYMPLFIINNAISLVGSNKIKANIDIVKSFKGTLNRIKGTCRNIEHFYSLYKQQKLNIYELKMFVGSVALIPPMLFQLKGKEIDKRNAISMAGDLFSGPTAKLIDWATDLRKNWKDLLDDENYIKFKNKVHSFNKAKKWRSYAKCNAPVLNSSKISEIKLSDDLVDNFINETLRHVDRAMYKTVDLDFYEKTYKKVESIAIENGAVLVGRFGSINHPSISDLDMMICFNDRDYKHGCEIVDSFIKSDLDISYIFPHSPMFVPKSMLNKIKYLHTLTNLSVTYSKNLMIDSSLCDDYRKLINMIWCFKISFKLNSIKGDFRYIDIRMLLMILKIIHKSIHNLEEILEIEHSDVLLISDRIRNEIKEDNHFIMRGKIERKIIEAGLRMKELLLISDKRTKFDLKEFSSCGNLLCVLSDSILIKHKNSCTIYMMNKTYLKLIYDIINKNDEHTKMYLNTLFSYIKIHRKLGGYIDKYVFIIPENYLEKFNIIKRFYSRLKSVLSLKFNTFMEIKN